MRRQGGAIGQTGHAPRRRGARAIPGGDPGPVRSRGPPAVCHRTAVGRRDHFAGAKPRGAGARAGCGRSRTQRGNQVRRLPHVSCKGAAAGAEGGMYRAKNVGSRASISGEPPVRRLADGCCDEARSSLGHVALHTRAHSPFATSSVGRAEPRCRQRGGSFQRAHSDCSASASSGEAGGRRRRARAVAIDRACSARAGEPKAKASRALYFSGVHDACPCPSV
mmetsp:Transcript_6857/g.22478  ORF Transcript_6857/g.22478 Transcript_6857/m.22478 type:complete len:222 (-) Transcript_6857:383-1048(-)